MVPSKSVRLPRTLLTIRCRAVIVIDEWPGSMTHVPAGGASTCPFSTCMFELIDVLPSCGLLPSLPNLFLSHQISLPRQPSSEESYSQSSCSVNLSWYDRGAMANTQTQERLAAWLALLQAQAVVTDAVEAGLVARRERPLA